MILCGDCMSKLKAFEDRTFTACVTDPPYGLGFMGENWDCHVPSTPVWQEIYRVLKPGAFLLAFGGTRTFHHLGVSIEDAGFRIKDCLMWLHGQGFPKSYNLGRRLKGWEGYGTSLKPAWEPIFLAMKPAEGSYLENAINHGVSGLNIDQCRVGSEEITINTFDEGAKPFGNGAGCAYSARKVRGRWPANVVLDEDSAKILDEQSGITQSGAMRRYVEGYEARKSESTNFLRGSSGPHNQYGDKGGASRFFYCAKALVKEKGESNTHPTVKPLELMRYLCRLVKMPEFNLILDPFVGSGTTCVAAKLEGMNYVGIELEEEYANIARNRLGEGANVSGKVWVKSVSSNVKSTGEHELAPCTFVVGKNGNGKSAIIDAVSLALLGEARSEKLGKKEADLMCLAPEGVDELYASAVLSDGSTMKWETSGSTESAKRAKHTSTGNLQPKCAVIASDLAKDVIQGSSKKLIEAILRATGGMVSVLTIKKEIPEALHGYLKLEEAESEISVSDLLELIEKLDKKKRDTASKIRALESSADVEEVQPLTEAELKMLQKLEVVFSLGTTVNGVENIAARAKAAMRDALEVTKGEVGEEAIAYWSDRYEYINALITTCTLAKKITEAGIESGKLKVSDLYCPLCTRKGIKLEDFEKSIARVEPFREEAYEIGNALYDVAGHEAELDVCAKVLANFDAAVAKFQELSRRARASSAGQAKRGSVPELTKKRDDLKTVLETLQKISAEQIEREAGHIERRLNRFLPRSYRAQVNASGKKCSIMLRKGKEGTYRDFRSLCGAEKALLIAAFASATLTETAASVRLLVLDDTWLDASMMKALMTGVTSAVADDEGGITQAILCAVDWGSKKVPDGWHVIRLDKKKKEEEDNA